MGRSRNSKYNLAKRNLPYRFGSSKGRRKSPNGNWHRANCSHCQPKLNERLNRKAIISADVQRMFHRGTLDFIVTSVYGSKG